MALPSYKALLDDPKFQSASVDEQKQLNDKYWSLYDRENPGDQWAQQMRTATYGLFGTKAELADAPPIKQRELDLQREAFNFSVNLGVADKENMWSSPEQRIEAVNAKQADFEKRKSEVDKTMSLFRDPKVDEAMQPAWQALTSSASMGEVFNAPDTWGDTALKGVSYVASAGGSSERRDKARADYEKYRSTMSQDFGLTTDEVDDLVKHRLDKQADPVSQDVAGTVHFRADLLVRPTSEIEKAIADSKLPNSVKETARKEAPGKIALFKNGVLDRVKKDYPELAADMNWTGTVDDDYATLTGKLNKDWPEQLGGGVAAAATKRAETFAGAPVMGPGISAVGVEQPTADEAAASVERLQKKQQAVNDLSSFINSDKTKIFNVDAATLGQGIYSVGESVVLGAMTGGAGTALVSADRIAKAGKVGRALLGFSKGALNTAPVAGIYGAEQGLQTYEQALASDDPKVRENAANLAVGSAAIEFGVTTVFGGIGLGGTEDYASKLASPALRKEAAMTIGKAWKNLAKNAGEAVVGEVPEEALITALDSVHIQQKLNPQMTDAEVRKAIYDTVVSTALTTAPLGGIKAVKEGLKDFSNVTTHDRSTDELKRESDDIYKAAAQESLAEDQAARGDVTPPSAERVAELGAERSQLTEQLRKSPPGGQVWLDAKERILEINDQIGEPKAEEKPFTVADIPKVNEQDTTTPAGEANAPQALQLPEVPVVPETPVNPEPAGGDAQGTGTTEAQAETSLDFAAQAAQPTDTLPAGQAAPSSEGAAQVSVAQPTTTPTNEDQKGQGQGRQEVLTEPASPAPAGEAVVSQPDLVAGLERWKGDNSDLLIHVKDELDNAPVPGSASGAKLRSQAKAIIGALSAAPLNPVTLYRGGKRTPQGIQELTANRKVAEKWAKTYGGTVHEVPANSVPAIQISSIIDSETDRIEQGWLVDNNFQTQQQPAQTDTTNQPQEAFQTLKAEDIKAVAPHLSDDVAEVSAILFNIVAPDIQKPLELRGAAPAPKQGMVQGELFQQDNQQGLPQARTFVQSFQGTPPKGATRALIDYAGDSLLRGGDLGDLPAHTVKDIQEADDLIQSAAGKRGKVRVGRIRFNDFLTKLWKRHHRGKKPGWHNFRSARDIREMGRILAFEIGHALTKDGSGVDWYRSKIDGMYRELSKSFPELAEDTEDRFLFSVILAVTSNGQSVPDNLHDAILIYQKARGIGKLPTAAHTSRSERNAAVIKAFREVNSLIAESGWQGAKDALLEGMTVSQLQKKFGIKLAGELADHNVIGAMILGPKIGSFWGNLNGHYESVTMDLWFTRTMNRLSGDTSTVEPDTVSNAISELKGMPGLSADVKRDIRLWEKAREKNEGWTRVPSDIREEVEFLYDYAKTVFRQYAADGFRDRSDLNKTAQKIIKAIDGGEDTPDNGTHRKWMRDVINQAQKQLRENDINITNADLQAILWFHEKDLYTRFGATSTRGERTDYEKAAAPALARAGIGRASGSVNGDVAGDVGRSSGATTGPVRGEQLSLFQQEGVTPEQDAEYLAAVESGDMETAQRMVDEAAKAARYVEQVYHGSVNAFTTFRNKLSGIWTAFDPKQAEPGSGDTASVKMNLYADPGEKSVTMGDEDLKAWRFSGSPLKWMQQYLARQYSQGERGRVTSVRVGNYALVVTSPSQLKSSETITRDKKGNVIPLSQRFNAANANTLYQQDESPGSTRHAELEARKDSLTPEELKEAQDLVNEAAKKAGYVTEVFHGSPQLRKIKTFKLPDWLPRSARSDIPRNRGAFFFSKDPNYSEEFIYLHSPAGARKTEDSGVGRFFVKNEKTFDAVSNPEHLEIARKWFDANREYAGKEFAELNDTDTWAPLSDKRLERIIEDLADGGWGVYELFPKFQDFIKKSFDSYALQEGMRGEYDTIAVFDPSQIKSAEPFTGVPLDQRFNPESPSILYQRPGVTRGSITFAADMGKAWITLMQHANASTFPHELAHFLRRFVLADNDEARALAERRGISVDEIQNLAKWAGVGTDGVWSTAAEEKFARGFERYLADGKAPTPALQVLFDKFSKYLKEIYGAIVGTAINVEISPEVRAVFDKLLAGPTAKAQSKAAPKARFLENAPAPSLESKKPSAPVDEISAKREYMDALRRKYGFPQYFSGDPVTDQMVTDEAVQALDAAKAGRPSKYKVGQDLVNELEGREKSPDAVEIALLVHEAKVLDAKLTRAYAGLEGSNSERQSNDLSGKIAAMEEQLNAISTLISETGTAAGRMLQSFKKVWDNKFDLVRMTAAYLRDKRAATGDTKATVSPEERKQIREINTRLKERKKALDDAVATKEKEIRAKEAEGVVKAVARDVKGKTAPAKESVKKQLRAAFDTGGALDRLRAKGFGVTLEQGDRTINWDAKGIGGTSNQEDISYFGYVRPMSYKTFRSIAAPGNWNVATVDFAEAKMRQGEAVSPPFLEVQWDADKKVLVAYGHEGRSRSDAANRVAPGENLPVHIFVRGMRARSLTDEIKNAPIVPEKGGAPVAVESPTTLLQQDLDPETLDDLATIGAGLILDRDLKNIDDFTAAIVDAMGPEAMDYSQEIYQRSLDKIEAARKSRKIPKSPEQLLKEVDPEKPLSNRMVFNMVRGYLLQEMEPDKVLKQVHNDLQEVWEDITFEEVSDAFTGYGKPKYPSTEEINVSLRKLRNVERIKRQLDVVRSGQAPKKTGFQRDKPDSDIRKLQKELKAAMKDAGIKVTRTNQLKSSLDAIKTRFRNELEDLQRAITKHEALPPKKDREEYDKEAAGLRDQVRDMRQVYEAIFDSEYESEQARLVAANRLIDEKISKEYEMLANGILSGAKKERKVLNDPTIKARLALLDSLQSARHAAQRALRPRKSQEQIALDAAIRENKKGLARDEERVRTGDTSPKTTTPRFTPNDELKAILAERASLKQILKLQRQQKARLGKPARDAARQEQRAAEAVERSLDKIEKRIQELASGVVMPPRRILPFTTPGLSAARALRDSRRRVALEMEKALKTTKSADQIREERMVKAANAKKLRYQEMIDKGILTKPARASAPVTEAVDKARFEAAQVEAEWNKLRSKMLWENRTMPSKVWSRVKTGLRATGVLRLGGDLGLLRHAGVWALGNFWRHPIKTATALQRVVRHGMTERGAYEIYQSTSEALALAGFSDKDIRLLNPMEPPGTAGRSRSGEEITGADILDMASKLPKKTVIGLGARGLRAIEFFNTSILNIARAETALALRGDPSLPMSDATRNAISVAAEVSTGRGRITNENIERAIPALNDWVFISTRWLISRIQMAYGKPLWSPGISMGTRAKILQEVYLKSVFGRAIVASLLAAMYPPEDDETNEEFLARVRKSMGWGNPLDSSYGKLKLSNGFSIDLAQGVGPFISTIARLTTGKTSRDGEIVDLRDDEKGRIAENYLKNRANMVTASLVRTLVTGRAYGGERLPSISRIYRTVEGTEEYPVDGPMLAETAKEWFAPIIAADTKRIYEQFGVKGVVLWSSMMTGAGVQSFKAKEKAPKFY